MLFFYHPSPSPQVIVQIKKASKVLPLSAPSVRKLALAFAKFHDLHFDEVAIHFVDTAAICALHEEFFNDPSPTDCISFPMDDSDDLGYRVLGEVFVCPETAVKYVENEGGNAYEELTLYVIHGLLHLIGFDDILPKDRKKMRAEEVRFLAYISEKNLWIHSL